MRQSLIYALAGAGMIAAMLAGAPTWAGPAASDGGGLTVIRPMPPNDAPAWIDPDSAGQPLRSDAQGMTERVGGMARSLEQDAGANHPGEDALGSGTSLTH